ncbi:hypothetical protein GE061_012459 [Apolygus lucorum]|uniref:Uncharacterized protein n=1 Tax=Apolygus lucorum TaxID=248454 RepID=A0A8S9XSB3_APOLU|nr:hypothetical protein GE061_012459 [Apolygus lucorum]
MSVKVGLVLLMSVIAATTAYGTSYTKLSKPHQSWFDYEISHSKHGSWHGGAHPHGYGGLGDNHSRSRRSAHGGWSKTYFSKPHQGKFEYDVEHDLHGSWHGSSHPDGYGGLGDGSGSYRLGGHSKVIGALPQGGQRDQRKADGARPPSLALTPTSTATILNTNITVAGTDIPTLMDTVACK